MIHRAYMTVIVLALLAGRSGADDGVVSKDDGFFTKIKILGSTTGQMQKDNTTLSGGLGLSAENTQHYLFLLINSGLTEKPPATGAPTTAYGQFLLSPPTTDLSLTLRYRYFVNDNDLTFGAYAQLDAGRGDISAMIAGTKRTTQGFAVALDAGAAGKMVISRQKNINLFLFTGLSSRFLGGDAARDDELKMATLLTTRTAFYGMNGSLLLQLGEVYAGLQLSYLSGDVPGLSGAQLVPVVGLRGGFDISTSNKSKSPPASPVAVQAESSNVALPPAAPPPAAPPPAAPPAPCIIL